MKYNYLPEADKKINKILRRATTKELIDDLKLAEHAEKVELNFGVLEFAEMYDLPELARRGYDREGNKLPYTPAEGEDTTSWTSRLKRWWYEYKRDTMYDYEKPNP